MTVLGPNDPRALRRADGARYRTLDDAARAVLAGIPTYCGACDETYTAGAVSRLCATHAAERAARLAEWHAAGGTSSHYTEHETETDKGES